MSNYKVTALTENQSAQLAAIRDEFLARGLSTAQDITEDEVEKLFAAVYKAGGLKAPKYGVQIVDSPLAIQARYTELTGDDTNQVGNFLYGSLSAGWLSFYETFIRLTPEVDGLDVVKPLIALVGRVSYYLPLEHMVIVSRNPVRISMENGLLHEASGRMAVEYADGFGCYSLFGTPVSEQTIGAVVRQDANAIMAIANVEERLVAMKTVGPGAMLRQLEAKQLEVSPNGEYTLFEVTIEGEKNKLLKMKNPSEPKDHYEFVPPEVKKITEALAWRIGWEAGGFIAPVAKT
jgi:hypothetical protein